MAENNEFLREVNEEYRRDQIARVWQRYGTLILALAVVLVGSVAGWRYWQHTQLLRSEAASERYDQATKLAKDGKTQEADKELAGLVADGPAGYQLLARFRTAAETSKTDRAEAATAYDRLAGDAALGDGLRDLARLRAALLRLDAEDPAPALTSLQGLAAQTNPFRHTAREMLGLSALRKGDYEAAGRWFGQISADEATPQALRQRIEVYEALVSGGAVETVAADPAARPEPESGTEPTVPEPAAPEPAAPPPPTR